MVIHKMGKTPIHWSSEERRLVAEGVFANLQAQSMALTIPNIRWSLKGIGQERLWPSRSRKHFTRDELYSMRGDILELQAAAKVERRRKLMAEFPGVRPLPKKGIIHITIQDQDRHMVNVPGMGAVSVARLVFLASKTFEGVNGWRSTKRSK